MVAECDELRLVLSLLVSHRASDKGLRTAVLIRFIGAEDGLLSHTHDGARMYVNIEGGCAPQGKVHHLLSECVCWRMRSQTAAANLVAVPSACGAWPSTQAANLTLQCCVQPVYSRHDRAFVRQSQGNQCFNPA